MASKTNKHVLLAITMVANFFNPFTGSAVNIALPPIAAELHLHAGAMSWVTMSYLLASAVFLVPMGKIGDRWGRRALFLWGSVVFMVASFACAFTVSATGLIAFRLLQGLGGAMMVSVSMAILMAAFEPRERGMMIGLNVASVYLGLSAAPVLGGFITEYWGWRSLFLLNGSVSVFVTIALFFVIRQEWKVPEKTPFDWKGVAWYVPSLLMLMYGLSRLPQLSAVALTLAGMLGLGTFIRLEWKAEAPVLNVRMFRHNKVFGLSNLSAFINYAATFAVSFILSLYLQYVKLLSPREAGLLLMAQPVMMALVSVLAGRLSNKYPPAGLASLGMGLSVVGLLLMAFLTGTSGNAYIFSALAVLGVGFGLFSSPNTNVVMSSVEHQYYGVASATLATMRNLGMVFSMAMATLAVHVFIGDRVINADTLSSFLQATRLVFFLFAGFCTLGVFTSLKRV